MRCASNASHWLHFSSIFFIFTAYFDEFWTSLGHLQWCPPVKVTTSQTNKAVKRQQECCPDQSLRNMIRREVHILLAQISYNLSGLVFIDS